MKKFLVLLLLVCLIGCNKEPSSLDLRVDEAINRALEEKNHIAKYKDKYLSYYVDPSIGRIEASSTSHVFDLDGNKFVMNLDVSNVINESLFELKENNIDIESFITRSGVYTNYEGVEEPYTIDVYRNEGVYLLLFNTNYLNFYSYTNEINCPLLVEEMMSIAKSVVINKKTVINDFNIKEIITYQPSYLDLFEEKIPENGSVEELIKEDDLLNEIENNQGGDN